MYGEEDSCKIYHFLCILYFVYKAVFKTGKIIIFANDMAHILSQNPFTQFEEETDVLTDEASSFNLIVWNDDVNTFDWVIETLVEVCGHTTEQAEQCSILIHYKGKCAVKKGSFEDLKPQCDAINDRLINATIEALVS